MVNKVNKFQRGIVFNEVITNMFVKEKKVNPDFNANAYVREVVMADLKKNHPQYVPKLSFTDPKITSQEVQDFFVQDYSGIPTQQRAADDPDFKPRTPLHDQMLALIKQKKKFSIAMALKYGITDECFKLYWKFPDDAGFSVYSTEWILLQDQEGNEIKCFSDRSQKHYTDAIRKHKEREDQAANKRTAQYWKDVQRDTDRKKFLADFANKHLDEKYAQDEKERDVKLQPLLKKYELLYKQGEEAQDEKIIKKLKAEIVKLVPDIMDLDGNFRFKRFTW